MQQEMLNSFVNWIQTLSDKDKYVHCRAYDSSDYNNEHYYSLSEEYVTKLINDHKLTYTLTVESLLNFIAVLDEEYGVTFGVYEGDWGEETLVQVNITEEDVKQFLTWYRKSKIEALL